MGAITKGFTKALYVRGEKITWQKSHELIFNVFWLTYTVGTYSAGKLSVVYEISMQVFPTVPSPTTTHLMGRPDDIVTFSLCSAVPLKFPSSCGRQLSSLKQCTLFELFGTCQPDSFVWICNQQSSTHESRLSLMVSLFWHLKDWVRGFTKARTSEKAWIHYVWCSGTRFFAAWRTKDCHWRLTTWPKWGHKLRIVEQIFFLCKSSWLLTSSSACCCEAASLQAVRKPARVESEIFDTYLVRFFLKTSISSLQ